MTELPRKAAARTARLAALPLGYAGRQAMGLGKRLGGRSAESVLTEVQQRTAEQLFRTLGELKGGAMKFGQVLSVLEAALPEEVSAPYREHLTALQDSAPPMPTATVREQLTRHLGADWPERLVWLDGAPTAAASIGQVHRGRWVDHASDEPTERDVAVKVQYPGAGEALMSDLLQISRVARGVAPVFPGLDIKPLVAELQARAADELDYTLEAEAQAAYAEAFADHPDIVVPAVVAVGGEVLVTEWMESPHSLAHVIREGTQEERDHYGEIFVRFLFEGPNRTGMLHADPHPGNFRVLPAPDGGLGRLGVLDFGAVARLEEGGMPVATGRLMRIALDNDEESLVAGLRAEGFIKDRIEVDPHQVMEYLAPFIEPAAQERFTFTREWMREQFERVNDPRSEAFTLAMKLNLPTSYLLIHRTWIGAIGLLSQLNATAPFREILEESLPGFAD
ncbi:ABC transporter ATP-binding protein [Nocardioides sp. Root122]|uniref:ABC1 kinase family protein n=1 Tax=Nocardioides TaxID=1839 RepID=UPI00070320F0|nr:MULTISPECIES: AarF/UbiB family protein [Nocardioides]KQV67857.1 ABC transporter ATP-binding protein [Nocardioides sp. Root122]MCK9823795.1 AarF/UbiB family protein [Nocardioides cavernae]